MFLYTLFLIGWLFFAHTLGTLLNGKEYARWWKTVLSIVLIAPYLLTQKIARHTIRGWFGDWFLKLAAWLTA